MAESEDSDKPGRGMSIAPEDAAGSQKAEREDNGENLSTVDVSRSSSRAENKNIDFYISAGAPDTEGGTEVDASKSVIFSDTTEVYDSAGNANTSSHAFVHDVGTSSTEFKKSSGTSEDSPTFLPVLTSSVSSGTNLLQSTSSAKRPSDLPLSQTFITEQSDSVSEAAEQEKEQTGHRHFEVSNVDESALRREIENDSKEKDLDSALADLENGLSLRKTPSTISDSDQSTYNANQDTIGPLENPYFLKMLNYSVSQTAEDDGFKGTSNLDLGNFTSTQTSEDMDGGWAWVVLFAAFFSLSLTGATTFAAGVLMPAILEIDPDITKASWIGAVHISVLCMSGPFVGIVLNCLGAKWTVFCAGIVLSLGLISASRADSIVQLIFTHGLISGMGSGFILNTMFVTVGQYFNRYRGLACGLLATGSGAGMLAGGNAMTALLNHFGLSGTYMLWAGITLHSTVFAMLLRPSPAERLREAEKRAAHATQNRSQILLGDITSMRSGLNNIYSGDRSSIFSRRTNSIRWSQKTTGRTSKQDQGVAPLLKTVLHRDVSRSALSVSANRSLKLQSRSNLDAPASPTYVQSKLSLSSNIPSDSLNASFTHNSSTAQVADSPKVFSQDGADQSTSDDKFNFIGAEKLPLLDSGTVSKTPEKTVTSSASQLQQSPTGSYTPSEFNRSFRRRLLSGSSQAPSRLSYRSSIREQLQRSDLDNESLASTLVSHLQPQDALIPRYRLGSRSVSSMLGSIASFPTALVIVKDDLSRVEAMEDPKKKESMSITKNKPFLMFISTCMLWALGDSPFSMYLPAYVVSKGSTRLQASSLYTAMGFGSMCGRFLSGLVASDSDVGPILLHIGCLSVASLVVGFSSWITSTYLEQMICAGLFGLYTGSLVPLTSLITIELLGIGDLGLGFGFLSMAQGIGYLIGPPLLGNIIQAIGYEFGFMISGFILLSASLLAMMIAVLLKDVREESIHDSFEDLDRALRRISDADEEEGGYDDEVPLQDLDHSARYVQDSVSKSKEEQSISKNISTRDGDHKEVARLESPETPSGAELETITEEA